MTQGCWQPPSPAPCSALQPLFAASRLPLGIEERLAIRPHIKQCVGIGPGSSGSSGELGCSRVGASHRGRAADLCSSGREQEIQPGQGGLEHRMGSGCAPQHSPWGQTPAAGLHYTGISPSATFQGEGLI